MEFSLNNALIDSASLALGFRNDSGTITERFRYVSAEIPQPILREICVKSASYLHEILRLNGVQPG